MNGARPVSGRDQRGHSHSTVSKEVGGAQSIQQAANDHHYAQLAAHHPERWSKKVYQMVRQQRPNVLLRKAWSTIIY
jgi:hypothetical protein